MTQQPLFVPASGGLETLLSRRNDPATSKAAAVKVARSGRWGLSLKLFKIILRSRGPLTVREASGDTSRPDYFYLEFNRRVHSWHVAGHIELTGEERGGGRVWRIR